MADPELEEIRARLPMMALLEHDHLEMRRAGANWVGLCPFHQERSGSFTVHGGSPFHAHCYGCGWHGDVFAYWMERLGCDFATSKAALAALAGVGVNVERRTSNAERRTKPKLSSLTHSSHAEKEKPRLPTMDYLRDEESNELAELRGLSWSSICSADAIERVKICAWPQWEMSVNGRQPVWCLSPSAAPCWVITDGSRNVAQFRRLDGQPFVRRDGKEIKAWTKGSPTWPIGCEEMGGRMCVLLVEGGADMLAGFHFLVEFEQLWRVSVVAMLGASIRIAEKALPYFHRKRVRIIAHIEEGPAGMGAAVRWTEQLTQAGAAVETFSLAGLTTTDGRAVKDLNDLALCAPEVWQAPEIRAAFFDFDF